MVQQVCSIENYRKEVNQILHFSAALTDRQKMVATYWADGPATETPPGHWNLFAQFVSRRDRHSLDEDVQMFFALGNALLDASIAVWEAKVHYDYIRPVGAIRFIYAGKPVRAWGGPGQGTVLIAGESWRSYIGTPQQCMTIRYTCSAGKVPFQNSCGCGCETP